MKQQTISVVVLNWNGADVTPDCLHSLERQTIKPNEIIVVDNGSVDGSAETIAKEFRAVKLLKQPKNLGFAGGVNVGIKASKSDYVFLLNNDATCEPDCLENLLQTAIKNDADITQAVILTNNGKNIDSCGDVYSIWGLPYPEHRNQLVSKLPKDDEPIFAASGGASMYKRTLFEEIGFFDESFFAYYEDVDISMRALELGYKNYSIAEARAYHIGSASSKNQKFAYKLSYRNHLALLYKNFSVGFILKHTPRLVVSDLTRMRDFYRLGQKDVAWAIITGRLLSIGLIPKMYRKRHLLVKGNKKHFKYINSLMQVGYITMGK